jgi:hypothetical protein
MKRLIKSSQMTKAPDLGEWSKYYRYATLQDIDDWGGNSSNQISTYSGAYYEPEDIEVLENYELEPIGILSVLDGFEKLEYNAFDMLMAVLNTSGQLEVVQYSGSAFHSGTSVHTVSIDMIEECLNDYDDNYFD